MKESNRNPFYAAVCREGITIAIAAKPSGDGFPARNPYFERVLSEGGVRFGRPRQGEARRPSIVRSVRVTTDLWKKLQTQARRERISTNEAVRQALQIWLRS